jgi:hypothetical protein
MSIATIRIDFFMVVSFRYRNRSFADPLVLAGDLEPDWCVAHRAGTPIMWSLVVANAQRAQDSDAMRRRHRRATLSSFALVLSFSRATVG